MPRISSFYGLIIFMFYDDHNPPHFHVQYAEYQALIAIQDFRVIRGNLPPKALSMAIEWAALRQEELMKDWELMKAGKPLLPIEPLK
jgi:hypothetical protein